MPPRPSRTRSRRQGRRRAGASLALALGLLLLALPPAAAQSAAPQELGDIGRRVGELRDELAALGNGIEAPDRSPEAARARAHRHLIDAQVAHGTGDYDTAAVMLYDYVESHPRSRSYASALFYLADSLFERGDHLAARERFVELLTRIGPHSSFYQQTLERLIELSLALRDDTDVARWLAALDQVPAERLRPSVHYVRGKYAYFRDRHQQAIDHFARVPIPAEYFFQARYFLGGAYVAQGNLELAEAVYRDLVARPPRGKDDVRVIDLSHLALGRILYENDRLVEAVDAYLDVDRKSDLFEDAAYEIAWVFVKQGKFDKALLAIELLAQIAPATSLVPSVEILEGNLRIRKAKALGTSDSAESEAEYERALEAFEKNRVRFAEAHDELTRVVEEHADPRAFIDQLAGRTSQTFELRATLPEVAAIWLRQHPGVERVVAVEQNLEQIADDVASAERSIERLEQALAEPARFQVFPSLASKRVRSIEILEELQALSAAAIDAAGPMLRRHATDEERSRLAALGEQRQGLLRSQRLLPFGESAYGERIARTRNAFVDLAGETAEATRVADAAAATLVAFEKYLQDREASAGGKGASAETRADIAAMREELEQLRAELSELRRDTTLAKDRAGTGDETALRGHELRARVRSVLAEERGQIRSIVGRMDKGSADRKPGADLVTVLGAIETLSVSIDELHARIDEVVEFSIADARSALVEEKARLSVIKRELGDYEAESHEIGGAVIGASFEAVKHKIYELLIRADVGVVDVGWSKKEDADESVRRNNLDELREQRRIDDELRLLFETQPAGNGARGGSSGAPSDGDAP